VNRLLVIMIVVTGCNIDLDEPWELAHDRIIAVRATPPRIVSGEQATLDVLLGYKEMPVAQRPPDFAAVVSPPSLMNAVTPDNGQWIVTAPGEEMLAAARVELDLPPGAPVPLVVGVGVMWPYPVVSPEPSGFGAMKTVWLGERHDNPSLDGMLVNSADAPEGAEIVVPKDTRVPLFVEADDTIDIVNWLTSCGEMHDFDLHSAYLVVTPDSKQEGELAVVYRDDKGGVTWRVWPIRAE
jgi:hypothetical protein